MAGVLSSPRLDATAVCPCPSLSPSPQSSLPLPSRWRNCAGVSSSVNLRSASSLSRDFSHAASAEVQSNAFSRRVSRSTKWSSWKCSACVLTCRATADVQEAAQPKERVRDPKSTNVLIFGATGYIGKFVTKEFVRRGYNVVAVAREKSGIKGKLGKEEVQAELEGAELCFSDVTDLDSLKAALQERGKPVDVVVSCLASRSGGVKDSWLVDYQATKNTLDAGVALGCKHYVLLSAICVQKPLLEFQRAKLKFEAELESAAKSSNGELTYSIVRPTAFFKSLGGQVELVKDGGPYMVFGDGTLCACKPISEADLASFIADCASDGDKVNKTLPIGGPGKALTPLEQGEMLFRITGKETKFLKVPIQIMDFAIGILDFLKNIFPNLEDAAEFGKIGRYYAAESMLVLNPETGKYDADATPSYGKDTLEEFFERVVREGMAGQELGDQAVF